MRQPSGTSWRATAAPCTPPPTPHWSIPSKSTPRWRTRSRKPDARRPAFSTRSDQCPAGSRTSPGSASPPDSQSADPRTKNRSSNGFPPVTLLDLDVDWGLGHEEDDENLRPAPPARARAVHRGRGPRAGSASHTPPFEQREHFSVGEFQPVRRSGSVRGPPGTALRLLQVRPTFAVLFAPLAYLPFALTFLCWTLLNGLLLWYALDRLLPEREATVALALLYLEVLLALQYGQSNALVAALMVLAFVAFEARRPVGAAVSITLGAAVKLFPLAALSVAVSHPRRLRFAAIFIAVLAAAIALPLAAIPSGDLLAQYRSWHAIEAKDTLRRGYSLMHYVHAWFGVDWPNWPLQAAGTALLLLPVVLRPDRCASLEFRRLFLCSLLVYSVLFNHASESPSFVVAYAGIVIWYVSSPPSRVRAAVMALTLLVMVVHDVDVVPRWVKYDLLVPYRIKGIPCLVAWFVMQWELLVTARSTARIDTGSFSPPASAAGA